MNEAAKWLITIGIVFLIVGLMWQFTDGKIALGKLPGDIRIETESVKIFVPVTTAILISVLFSGIFYLFSHFRK